MRIAARMAVEAEPAGMCRSTMPSVLSEARIRALGYHGYGIVISRINETGFVANTNCDFAINSHVRLKLPGNGTLLARINWTANGQVGGEFFNTINPLRLRKILGMGELQSFHSGPSPDAMAHIVREAAYVAKG